jgi:hypothetical protein
MGPGSPSGLADGLDESVGSQTWHYPSRSECLQCHTGAANFVLGPKARQLNGAFTYPSTGISDNQLRTWNYLQMFTADIGEGNIAGFTRLVAVGDTSAPLAERVRSYLDSNCGQCHRPGGVDAYWDGRYDTLLASQGIVDGVVKNDLGVAGAEVVRPQHLPQSLMHVRMNSVDPTIRMPPLARNLVDTAAVAVLDQWINSLPPSAATPPAAPSGLTATAVSGTRIDLAWTDNAFDETGVKIERKTGAGGTYAQIAVAVADATTASDTGLVAGTTYYYRVRASNGAGDSAYSNEASATTTAVTAGGPPASSSSSKSGHCGFGSAATGILLMLGWLMRRQLRQGRFP